MIESHPTRDQREVDFTVEQWTKRGWTCEVVPHKGTDGGTFWTVRGQKPPVEKAPTDTRSTE